MFVVTFSSLKGGTGKSSSTIMVAKCLAAFGKKVLVIDADINNSCSFYFLQDPKDAEVKNLAFALQGNSLLEFTVKSKYENIDLIASSLRLVDLRALSTSILKRLIPTLKDSYDFVLIDTAPTYDNIVLNCIGASDYVLTPINYDQFNFNTTIFLSEKLRLETEKFNNWFLFFNGHESRYDHNENSLQNEYKKLFSSHPLLGQKILGVEIPFTRNVRKFADTEELLSTRRDTLKLYSSICDLCSIITGEDIHPDRF